MSDSGIRARELAQWLFNEPPTESESKFLASAIDAAELRGKREGLREAKEIASKQFGFDVEIWRFCTKQEMASRMARAIVAAIGTRLADLGAEPEGK